MTYQISQQIILELLKDCKSPDDIFGENGLLNRLNKQITDYAIKNNICSSQENIDESHFSHYLFAQSLGLDIKKAYDIREEIISLYTKGLSKLDIQLHIDKTKNIKLSPSHITRVINDTTQYVNLWKDRTLDKVYPIVYLDGLRIAIRDDDAYKKKTVYIALGINLSGKKEVLGLWIENYEGSKFWASALTNLKNRGVNDVLIFCCDGLIGLPASIKAIYPNAQVQLCLIHQKRYCLSFVKRKDYASVSRDLQSIYTSATLEMAEKRLNDVCTKWEETYPIISRSWQKNWDNLISFYQYSPEIRKVLYTNNAIESLNASLRKVADKRNYFNGDQIALNTLYLYIDVLSKKWTMPIPHWQLIIGQFKLLFEDRL